MAFLGKKVCKREARAGRKHNTRACKEDVGPRPIFGEPWSCLTIFGTSTGWLKTEHPGKAEIAGSHPLLWDFWV
jgi:hypothetical protein